MTKSNLVIKKLDKNAPCLLCGKAGRVESHIVPQFVTRYLRETGATHYLRSTRVPNVRQQGDFWDYLLCKDCETLFSRWENQFARKVFRPTVTRGQRRVLSYDRWLALFATSLTWRALVFHREHPEFDHPTIPDWSTTNPLEEAWRECLLGQSKHPGKYEQHLLLIDYIVGATLHVPSNLNTFLTRSSDFRVMSNGRDTLVYSRLPNFMFVGLGDFRGRAFSSSTRVGFNGGVLGGPKIKVPDFIWKLIVEGANKVDVALSSMSDKQHRLVAEGWRSDPERVLRSGTLEAMRHDYLLSGEAGLRRPTKSK